MHLRTSLSDPLRIDAASCKPAAPGLIGMTICPGKCGSSVHGTKWQRDLERDVDAVHSWRPDIVITLLEAQELDFLRVPTLGEAFTRRGIRDLTAPGAEFLAKWVHVGPSAVNHLRSGGKVLVHCRGGLGRAGTVAGMLLIELGVGWRQALLRVRRARPGAVETAAQERFLEGYQQLFARGGR
jgi:hypothetical protein